MLKALAINIDSHTVKLITLMQCPASRLNMLTLTLCLMVSTLSLYILDYFRQRVYHPHQKLFGATRPKEKYPRLSSSLSTLKPSYDIVIIGSGYSSGVAASRFARAGRSVCVLERGFERWPGQYPHTAANATKEYGVSGHVAGRSVRVGKNAGLYQTFKGEGQDVFLGCGLGGTSLINAGVWLRADAKVLEGPEWPTEIRQGELEAYYERAEQMFQPTSFPSTHQTPAKFDALELQARNLGLQGLFYRPPLTTFFGEGMNTAGVHMKASIGSGNECTGTNDGSKNSVLVTYLADAWARGAELFCGVDVQYIKKRKQEGGYVVFFETRSASGTKKLAWVIAVSTAFSSFHSLHLYDSRLTSKQRELVILGAGAIGTPSILLRSRLHGLSASPLLGQRISGNGDRLTFAYNCSRELNSIGREHSSVCGPTITGCIDLRSSTFIADNVRNGFVIQDGAIPEVLAPVIQMLLETHTVGPPSRLHNTRRGTLARIKSWLFGPYTNKGSVRRTMVFLTMSHDEDNATMTLENGDVVLRWEGASEMRTAQVDSMLRKMVNSLGGILVKSPLMTVHPLGGAVMSSDETGLGGVVNHRGELFAGCGGEMHEGMFCVDGSIVPTSLGKFPSRNPSQEEVVLITSQGVNPCATITALAERTCDLIIQEHGWSVDEDMNGELDLFGDPPYSRHSGKEVRLDDSASGDMSQGVQFDETMHGHIHIGSDIAEFTTAENVVKTASSSARLTLTVDARHTDGYWYAGSTAGTFSCSVLSPDPFIITSGSVDFFSVDEDVADAKQLAYRLELLSTTGSTYTFHGFKQIDPSITLSVGRTWCATTTLYTTITASDGSLTGRGILHLSFRAFTAEILSLKALNTTDTHLDRIRCISNFLSFFAYNLTSYFLSPFRPLQQATSSSDTSGYYNKPTPTTIDLTASDGLHFPLKMWHPPPTVIQKATPIIFLPGASVNVQIFSLPTIPTNTIDYFTRLGYTCFVPILRFGSGENARYGYTAFDARLDVAAAVQHVFATQVRKPYIIAHCLGSIALGTGLLNGDVEAKFIAGVTCSQVFTHIDFSTDNRFKATRPWLISVYKVRSHLSYHPILTIITR